MNKITIHRSKNILIVYTFTFALLFFIVIINIIKLTRNELGSITIISLFPIIFLLIFLLFLIRFELHNPYIIFDNNSITIIRFICLKPIIINVGQISLLDKLNNNMYEIILKDSKCYRIDISNASEVQREDLVSLMNKIKKALHSAVNSEKPAPL
jgi:hypothetical protein